MRPAGAVRAALRAHMDKLAEADRAAKAAQAGEPVSGPTWRDLAAALADAGLINMAAPSELRLVEMTVKNMRRAGELREVGEARRVWSRRPLKVYGAFAVLHAQAQAAAGAAGAVGDVVPLGEAMRFLYG